MIYKNIYDKIAAKLTDLYVEEAELPRPIEIWAEDQEYYRFIIYLEDYNAFYFAGWTGNSDEEVCISYDGNSPIDFARAVREVWDRLGESDRTELMATVLGAKDGH